MGMMEPGEISPRMRAYQEGIIDAALTVVQAHSRFNAATTPINQAHELVKLHDAVFDLSTWLPDFDPETGELKETHDGNATA